MGGTSESQYRGLIFVYKGIEKKASAYRNIYKLYKRSPLWIVTKQKPLIGEAKTAIGINVPLYIIKCEK